MTLIRRAAADDVPALAKMAEASFQTAFANLLEPEALKTRDEAFFLERFSESWSRTSVAVEERGLLGFLLLTDGHIDMLFMDVAMTGRGVGASLLQYAEAQGAKSLECFRDNHRARSFYERHGWVLTKDYERDFAGKPRSFVFYEKT